MVTYPQMENYMLYGAYESARASFKPLREMAKAQRDFLGLCGMNSSISRTMQASLTLVERMTREYPKPEFGITETVVDGKSYPIKQNVVLSKTFCDLIHFRKPKDCPKKPKMLLVAPMSGHYATLLRGTVEAFLQHFDVYITDWKNVRDVELYKGEFEFHDFVDYLIEFITKLGTKIHITAVCQPSVPLYAAACLLSEDNNKDMLPLSLTLMGGPIDTRHSPTEVNDFALEKKLNWFEKNLITIVPPNYKGFMRRVYPGFLQLSGFMAMNLQVHMGEHLMLFKHLVEGDGDSVEKHNKFYNEYLSIMDLPAPFYVQTVDIVFKNHSLPKGKLKLKGRAVNPASIENIPILCIEGENDDISGIGQTKAALDISVNLPTSKKRYHLQKDVGHYGIFNGRRFREQIVPVICEFTKKHQ